MPEFVVALPIAAAVLALLAGLGWLWHWVLDNPRRDFESGMAFHLGRVYATVMHGLRVRGRENRPDTKRPGPLILVCNHTAGVDPILVQTACPFHIRWMMAEDMAVPLLDWFWSWWGIIFINRARPMGQGVREALRELKKGGVVAIFPEGGLERPPRQVMPFQTGVGMMIKKSGAPVLPVVIDGTPQFDPAWASLWRPSTSTVHFHPIVDYRDTKMTGEEIATDLRRRFERYTGWPFNDSPPPWQREQEAPAYGRPAAREGEGEPPLLGRPVQMEDDAGPARGPGSRSA
jgi:1-acyl-sn-glycerol-3-phosphate acyltransferase